MSWFQVGIGWISQNYPEHFQTLHRPSSELACMCKECFFKEFWKFFWFSIIKKNTLYTCKQPLMMAYEGSESAWDNFGKFIHQFQPETKTLIRKLEKILIKLYRQNVPLLFNQTFLNERLLPNYTHIYVHISIFYSWKCAKEQIFILKNKCTNKLTFWEQRGQQCMNLTICLLREVKEGINMGNIHWIIKMIKKKN